MEDAVDLGGESGRASPRRRMRTPGVPLTTVQASSFGHVDEDVAGQHPLLDLDLLAVLRLDHLFGGDDDAPEALLLVHRDDPVLEIGLDLVLVPGVGVDHVPVEHRAVFSYCPRSTSRTNGGGSGRRPRGTRPRRRR
jgi:hypothetical protein